jgi:hypothetical protein
MGVWAMTSISDKTHLIIEVLLVFLLVTTYAFALGSSSIYITNYGTLSYSGIFVNARQSELRGCLIKYISQYAHNDSLIAQTLAGYGLNAIYLESSPFYYTGYSLSFFQDMINACKQYNLTFHVLLKLNSGTGADYTNASEQYPYGFSGYDPNWCTALDDGTTVPFVSFSNTATRNRVKQVIEAMLKYFPDIADINLDYVRYPTSELSSISNINFRVPYDNASKTAFLAWLAANNKTFSGSWSDYYYSGSHYADFATWRAIPIDNIVRDIRAWTLAAKPTVMITADVWTPWNGQGWTPDLNIYSLGQDVAYWMNQGYLDAINPMNYVPDLASLKYRMSNESTYWLGGTSKGPIPVVPFITQGGPGSDVGAPIPISTWLQQINYLRQSGDNGFIIWRYNGPGFSESPPWTDVTPYLAAIQSSSANGAYPVFRQGSLSVADSTITWQTSLATTGKVEYSSTPIFTSIPKNGTLLPYILILYMPGTILAESGPSLTHSITVPLSPPFYYRISNNDSNVELDSPVYQAT